MGMGEEVEWLIEGFEQGNKSDSTTSLVSDEGRQDEIFSFADEDSKKVSGFPEGTSMDVEVEEEVTEVTSCCEVVAVVKKVVSWPVTTLVLKGSERKEDIFWTWETGGLKEGGIE